MPSQRFERVLIEICDIAAPIECMSILIPNGWFPYKDKFTFTLEFLVRGAAIFSGENWLIYLLYKANENLSYFHIPPHLCRYISYFAIGRKYGGDLMHTAYRYFALYAPRPQLSDKHSVIEKLHNYERCAYYWCMMQQKLIVFFMQYQMDKLIAALIPITNVRGFNLVLGKTWGRDY